MNEQQINQRIKLINAVGLGWEPCPHAESIEELVADAERWMKRWHNNSDTTTVSVGD